MDGDKMIKTPEALRRSVEQFMLDVTEPLDPLLALKLTQLVVRPGDTAYAMGSSDGQRNLDERCCPCPGRLLGE
jgi:hypothetical protein